MATDETETKTTVDPSIYLEKAATPLQNRFSTWIQEEVGYNPNTAKTKAEAFAEGVRIATATRMVFQASDFNRAETAKERAAREAAAAAAAEEVPVPKPAKATKAAPAPAPAKAAPAKKAAKKAAPAPVAAEAEEAEEAEAPAKTPARRPARRAAAKASSSGEAPF